MFKPYSKIFYDINEMVQVGVRKMPPSLVAGIAFLEHVGEAVLQKGLVALHLYPCAKIYQLPVFLCSEYQELQRNFQAQLAEAQPRAAQAAQRSALVAPIVAQQLREPLSDALVSADVNQSSTGEAMDRISAHLAAANEEMRLLKASMGSSGNDRCVASQPVTTERLTDLQRLYQQREEQTVLDTMPWRQQHIGWHWWQEQQGRMQQQQQLQHHMPQSLQQQHHTAQTVQQQQHMPHTVQQQQQHTAQTVQQQQHTAQTVQQQQHMLHTVQQQQQHTAQTVQQQQHTAQTVQQQQHMLHAMQQQHILHTVLHPPQQQQQQQYGQPEGAAVLKNAGKKRAQKNMFLRNGPGQRLTILKV
jgi:hypothetical protein